MVEHLVYTAFRDISQIIRSLTCSALVNRQIRVVSLTLKLCRNLPRRYAGTYEWAWGTGTDRTSRFKSDPPTSDTSSTLPLLGFASLKRLPCGAIALLGFGSFVNAGRTTSYPHTQQLSVPAIFLGQLRLHAAKAASHVRLNAIGTQSEHDASLHSIRKAEPIKNASCSRAYISTYTQQLLRRAMSAFLVACVY